MKSLSTQRMSQSSLLLKKLLSSLHVVDLPLDFFISALFEGVQDTVPETGLKLDKRAKVVVDRELGRKSWEVSAAY